MASLQNDIQILIQNGGLGRLPAGTDYYSGMVFQSPTTPSEFGTDVVKRIYSVAQAEALGITVANYPVEHYQIYLYFELLEKWNYPGLLDVMFSNITTGDFVGTEIYTMQANANYELKQILVFLIDPYASTFITGAQSVCDDLNNEGYPTSVGICADVADLDAVGDLRDLDSEFVSFIGTMDAAGTGNDLFNLLAYSIGIGGAWLASEAYAKVNENIGWVKKFDISLPTELQTLATVDGTLMTALTNTQIDAYNTAGITLAVKRRKSGTYWYDDPTCTLATSDFAFVKDVRTISKAKRLLIEYYAEDQNAPLFVSPKTGYMTEQTISYLKSKGRQALGVMVNSLEIPADEATGQLSKNAITIDPTQDVVSTDKVIINAKVTPTGVAKAIEIPLGFGIG